MNSNETVSVMDADKIGSATSPLNLSRSVAITSSTLTPRAGDVVVVRTLTDSATYNMLGACRRAASPKSIRAMCSSESSAGGAR